MRGERHYLLYIYILVAVVEYVDKWKDCLCTPSTHTGGSPRSYTRIYGQTGSHENPHVVREKMWMALGRYCFPQIDPQGCGKLSILSTWKQSLSCLNPPKLDKFSTI